MLLSLFITSIVGFTAHWLEKPKPAFDVTVPDVVRSVSSAPSRSGTHWAVLREVEEIPFVTGNWYGNHFLDSPKTEALNCYFVNTQNGQLSGPWKPLMDSGGEDKTVEGIAVVPGETWEKSCGPLFEGFAKNGHYMVCWVNEIGQTRVRSFDPQTGEENEYRFEPPAQDDIYAAVKASQNHESLFVAVRNRRTSFRTVTLLSLPELSVMHQLHIEDENADWQVSPDGKIIVTFNVLWSQKAALDVYHVDGIVRKHRIEISELPLDQTNGPFGVGPVKFSPDSANLMFAVAGYPPNEKQTRFCFDLTSKKYRTDDNVSWAAFLDPWNKNRKSPKAISPDSKLAIWEQSPWRHTITDMNNNLVCEVPSPPEDVFPSDEVPESDLDLPLPGELNFSGDSKSLTQLKQTSTPPHLALSAINQVLKYLPTDFQFHMQTRHSLERFDIDGREWRTLEFENWVDSIWIGDDRVAALNHGIESTHVEVWNLPPRQSRYTTVIVVAAAVLFLFCYRRLRRERMQVA